MLPSPPSLTKTKRISMSKCVSFKWEYKVAGFLDEKALNNLGDIGWELVSVLTYSNGSARTMIFKRPVIERSDVVNDAFGLSEAKK